MKKLVKTKALIDGIGDVAQLGACFLIDDARIETVGPAEAFTDLPPDTEVIDLSTFYVLPGIVNAHTHLSIVPALGDQLGQMRGAPVPKALKSIANMQLDLSTGVTTSRIMGEEHFIDVDIRAAIEAGTVAGPRLNISGKPIAASNGHGVALTTSDGPEEVRKNARLNLAKGTDFVKIFASGGLSTARPAADACTIARDEVAAAVEVAKRAGTYVAAHAHGGEGLDYCIEEGVRTIEHGAMITPEQLDRIIAKGMWVVTTSAILYSPNGIEKTDFNNPAIREKVLRARDVVGTNLSRVVASGANVATGTDSIHGDMGYEMKCLVDFGASNMAAIKAATIRGAEVCQMQDSVGSIEAGKFADFIAVSKDPLADIGAMREVARVFKGGVEWRTPI